MQIEIHGRPLLAGSGIKQRTKNNMSMTAIRVTALHSVSERGISPNICLTFSERMSMSVVNRGDLSLWEVMSVSEFELIFNEIVISPS